MSSSKHNYPMDGDEPAYPALEVPETVEHKAVTVWANGVALDADLFRPKGLAEGTKVPAIVLSHGWGGRKRSTDRYGAKFAENGMIALCVSQAGWGESDGQLMQLSELPELDENDEATARVKAVRKFVDPIGWVENCRACVDYLVGEPNVDADRLGAWGTSFGGGVAMFLAANDPRIKALSIQVSALLSLQGPMRQHAQMRASAVARGDLPAIPVGVDTMPNLSGSVHFAKALQYDVMLAAERLTIPTLMIDGADEDMLDIKENSGKAFEILKANGVTAQYEVFEGTDHYGIYFQGFERGSQMACDWFKTQLAS